MIAAPVVLPDYQAQIATAIRAVAFDGATGYAWFGTRAPRFPRAIRQALAPPTVRRILLYQLQAQLYRDFYCRGVASLPRGGAGASSLADQTPFVEQLMAANAGRGSWVTGWPVGEDLVGIPGGPAWRVPLEDRRLTPADGPGTAVRLPLPKHLPGISPGYYTALSDQPLELTPDDYLVRLYWNLDPPGAVRLIAVATGLLNQSGLPFRLKVVGDPAGFLRCDTGVLYLCHTDYAAAAALLPVIYQELTNHLRSHTPALTLPLAVGLGLAEDPGGGDSFGMHRCLLLAQGLLAAAERGHQQPAARLQQVVETFAQANISIHAPFLRPGSSATYSWAAASPTYQVLAERAGASVPDNHAPYRHVAEAIGFQLAQEALWAGDYCTWIGETLLPGPYTNSPGGTYQALGPDLYGGTSGIALFLAELGVVTHDSKICHTALGAIRHALAAAERVPVPLRVGLYTGWVGLALAAVRVGQLLDEADLVTQAERLLHNLDRHSAGSNYDFLSGRAGAIVGLLILRNMLGSDAPDRLAIELGTELLDAADKGKHGYSWRTAIPAYPRNLTGLSHGAAGIGASLLELYAMTGAVRFRRGAEEAYAYERHWFDPMEGNWADLRFGSPSCLPYPIALTSYWCHGAPGIALTRLRAYELLADNQYKNEAVNALETTHRAIGAMIHGEHEDFCLCHGLSGITEILLFGSQLLRQQEDLAAGIARQVAQLGINRYSATGRAWPCGGDSGESPGLMLGLAGIGSFYLRLYHRTTTSNVVDQASTIRASLDALVLM